MIIETRPDIDFSTFPDSDGKPVAETETNFDLMIDLIVTLRGILVPSGHHVGGNLLVYWDPTDGWKHCSPDVFVALDAGPERRASWKVWEEGKFPEVVMEIASPSTQKEDIGAKVALYAERGVLEYYIFDPAGTLDPAFRGYVRQGGALVQAANPTGSSIVSGVLGLELRVVEGWLRVIDQATGKPYPTLEEERTEMRAALQAGERARRAAERAMRAAETRAAEEARARQAAEAQAAEEAQARQAAELQAAEEARARHAAEAEAARLRAMLARLGADEAGFPPGTPDAR